MKIRNINFREHIMSFVIVPLIIIVGIFSFYRFIIKNDYVVGYQGVCDPAIGKCFMNCEDDACTKVDYYDNVIKYAPDLFNECGGDITDCEVASRCLPSDHKCSISYCDKNNSNDTCEPETQNNNPVNSLQNDNINDSNI